MLKKVRDYVKTNKKKVAIVTCAAVGAIGGVYLFKGYVIGRPAAGSGVKIADFKNADVVGYGGRLKFTVPKDEALYVADVSYGNLGAFGEDFMSNYGRKPDEKIGLIFISNQNGRR